MSTKNTATAKLVNDLNMTEHKAKASLYQDVDMPQWHNNVTHDYNETLKAEICTAPISSQSTNGQVLSTEPITCDVNGTHFSLDTYIELLVKSRPVNILFLPPIWQTVLDRYEIVS